jgi:hypothetical protein
MLTKAACWASAGYNVAGCQALETQLRTCMDTPVCFISWIWDDWLGWDVRLALGGEGFGALIDGS